MQDTTFQTYEEPAEPAPSRFSRIRHIVSTAIGAVVALSLLLALGVWFYRLGVRDAQNVPIIRASTDPAKVRPEDPGGAVAPHQGVSSYEIAESGEPSAVAALVAPEPAKPTREDVAMRDLQSTQTNEVDQLVGQVLTNQTEDVPAAADQQSAALAQPTATPTPTVTPTPAEPTVRPADPVVQALTEPTQPTVQPTDTQVAAVVTPTQEEPAAPEIQAEPEPEPEITTRSELAPSASPVYRARPADLVARTRSAAAEAKQDKTNLVTAAAKSAVQIQLAADPSKSAIEQRWRRVFSANKDILRDRALAIQTTQSGGTMFYRLRVGPFKNRSEAVAGLRGFESPWPGLHRCAEQLRDDRQRRHFRALGHRTAGF